ncbi:hypothetical protein GCM10011490_19370 [Pseudoclavibacter endophyticus]|nr:SMI1/KNR4 family protein [Pseudoclavibacter endophyticus]GGA68973.1 hypothetical protein GCM10011490_19370 [Pseudoclavibacter endophyticus]
MTPTAGWRDELDAAWREIEEWYAEHDAAHLLSAGASEADVGKVEAQLDVVLPALLRASLLRHNGTRRDGWARGTLLSCGSIVAATELWRRIADHGEDVPADYVCPDAERGLLQPGWWHAGWVAIDEDRLGNATGVDTAPGPLGSYGQVLEMDRITGPILSSGDVVEYLCEVADSLEDLRVGGGGTLEENDVWEGDDAPSAPSR